MSTSTEPTKGKTVFSRRGERASYAGKLGDIHLVRPFYEVIQGDGESYEEEGPLTEWEQVFLLPPVAKLNEEVATLERRVRELQETISAKRRENEAVDREIAGRKGRLAQHEALALLDTFLTKGLSHYVMVKYGEISILPFEETEEERSSYDYSRAKPYKMLTLFGRPGNGLNWRLFDYSEGSGSSYTVYPCVSLEAARIKAAQLIEERLAEWRKDPTKNGYLHQAVKAAHTLGFLVPDDAQASLRAEEIKSATDQLVAAQATLDKAQANLAAVTAGAPNQGGSVSPIST